MVSALFQPEISSLESQVAALQAQIAQAQARVAALSECEADADGMLQVVQKTLGKVSALAPSAVATLKSAVFALFNSGDSDGSGGQPIPLAPNPEPLQPLQLVLDGQSTMQDNQQIVDIEPEQLDQLVLDGQSTVCLLEGTEVNSEICSNLDSSCLTASDKEPEPEKSLFNFYPVTDSIAYMSRGDDGEISCAYAGFNNKTKAKQWGEWLAVHHSVASGFEVREAKRLTEFKHELKLWGMSLGQIQRLAGCDLMKSPPSNYGDAPKRKLAKIPSALEIEDIGVGDTVRSITVKNWQWKVTKINSDGLLECDRIGTNPVITQTLHPGSVELVHKADVVDAAAQELEAYIEQQAQSIAPVIDSNDVPRGVILRQTSDDFIVEYLVYAWVVVRNQGKPEPCQKHFGRLVEGLGIIEAYKPVSGRHKAFSSTMDAVNFLINTSDYRQSDIDAGIELYESRQQKVLVGAGSSAQQLEDIEF